MRVAMLLAMAEVHPDAEVFAELVETARCIEEADAEDAGVGGAESVLEDMGRPYVPY